MSSKRRRSGSSVATISDESDEYATPEPDASPSFVDDDEEDEISDNNLDGSYTSEDEPLRPPTSTPASTAAVFVSSAPTSTASMTPITIGSGRKRKKLDPSELCQQLYDSVRNVKKDDGMNLLCENFIRAPSRRSQPEYYEVVSNPIDLLRVQQKLKTDAYQNLDELMADFEQIIKNAKSFYKPESPEYQDASTLWKLLNVNKQKIISDLMDATAEIDMKNSFQRKNVRRQRKSIPAPVSVDDSVVSDDEEMDVFEELFASLMTACDATDQRPMYLEFQLLPSKKLYPDYYSIIEQPIDLKMIATKIQNKDYETLDDMEYDLQLMVKNACTYNDPDSQIYHDARQLKEIFLSKKASLEGGSAVKTQFKRRGQSFSAVTAALVDTDDIVDDSMSGRGTEVIMMRIFNQLNNHPNPLSKDEPVGATLWRLPHPRWEKHFYEIATNPISMSQIQTKIKKGGYRTFTALKADFERMCNNYLTACKPEHRLYVAANQMKAILDQTFAPVLEQGAVVDSGGSATGSVPTTSMGMEESDTVDTDTSSVMSSSNKTPVAGGAAKKQMSIPVRTVTVNSLAPVPKIHTEIQRIPPQAKAKLNFHNALVKNKLLQLHRYLIDSVREGRYPIENFIELPSAVDYPDYYEIIAQPIDMTIIEANIKGDKYSSLEEALADYRKMFSNCRQYNQDGSLIVDDANFLERLLNERVKEVSVMDTQTTTIGATTIKKITTNGNIVRQAHRRLPTANPVIIQAVPVSQPPPQQSFSPSDAKLRQFYDILRDFRCPRSNRQLSLSYMRLPLRLEFPDYYELVKSPIDMERIFSKLKSNQYSKLDQLYDDFLTMLRNACLYYDIDSPMHKDAIELQKVCFETARVLKADDNVVPDVQKLVHDLLRNLFFSVISHEDADGRLYSDSLGDVPDYDIKSGKKVHGTTLELIKMRVLKGEYKRLDNLQEDLFACLERARLLTKCNSQVFEDSIELQSFYIAKRDELCKKGELLSSSALGYSTLHLSASIETLRQQKLAQEPAEPDDDGMPVLEGDSMIINEKLYSPGDFLYYACPEINAPGIMCVERLWINNDNIPMMSGNLFLRPAQVIHSRLRKFIEKEVFKSDKHVAMPLNKLQGKCYVMSVKDYFKLRPEGFLERDLYVCESRYNSRTHAFKKIKTWNHVTNKIRLVQREIPIEMKRALIAKVERSKEELAELEANVPLPPREKPNVPVTIHGVEEGRTYYEQYNLKNGLLLKTGDFVFTDYTESDMPSVVQVCAIYETRDGNSFFRGPFMKHPRDLPNASMRMFFKNEILLSTQTETTPTSAILRRCAVMENPEYTSRRPTELPEKDVFICESVYDEIKGQIRKLSKPGELKKIVHSQMVVTDEFYFFLKPIVPHKVQLQETQGPAMAVKTMIKPQLDDELKGDISEFLDLNEDSMDIESLLPDAVITSSPASQRTPPIGSPAPFTSSNDTTEKISRRSKTVTGFILFQSQYRKLRHEENPGASFGEVSRMLGEEWKLMGPAKRAFWKDKALRANEEARQQFQVDNPGLFVNNHSSNRDNSTREGPTGVQIFNNLRDNPQNNQVFDCCWHSCDYEFEDPQDLLDHTLSTKTSCIQANLKISHIGTKEYECRWRTCNRIKRGMSGFPDWPRLLRHVREVHIYRHLGRVVPPEKRSINFVPRKHQQKSRSQTPVQLDSTSDTPTVPSPAGSPGLTASQIESGAPEEASNPIISAGPAPEPLFITVPPRPSRVLHSEAYIRYIESLNKKSSSQLSQNKKSLRATQETTPPVDPSKLPTHWFGKKAQEHPERVVNALWNLRTYMMKDVLALYRLKN